MDWGVYFFRLMHGLVWQMPMCATSSEAQAIGPTSIHSCSVRRAGCVVGTTDVRDQGLLQELWACYRNLDTRWRYVLYIRVIERASDIPGPQTKLSSRIGLPCLRLSESPEAQVDLREGRIILSNPVVYTGGTQWRLLFPMGVLPREGVCFLCC